MWQYLQVKPEAEFVNQDNHVGVDIDVDVDPLS